MAHLAGLLEHCNLACDNNLDVIGFYGIPPSVCSELRDGPLHNYRYGLFFVDLLDLQEHSLWSPPTFVIACFDKL